jgi:RNA-directed DNA polymerase
MTLEGKMAGTQTPDTVYTGLQRIADLARKAPEMAIRTLAHHIDVDLLREAYRLTRKSGAVGVDGQTAAAYAENLDENLISLLNRFKSGTYRAPPVRRVHIPKEGGKTRPIGIPTFEDKVLQRAVAMVLNAVYEQDFLGFSYGFRPRRSAHQALVALREGLMEMDGGCVLDADIKDFYGSLVPAHLRKFLDQRVVDGVIRRTIDKWLKAGVLEDGNLSVPETGTPQGGVVSPILSNIYLHEVLDRWFVRDVQPRLAGKAFMIRFADDFVIVFEQESDARRVMAVLPQRFAKFGLELHPEKTRLVPFRKPAAGRNSQPAASQSVPEAFDLLGFTHTWQISRAGYWVVMRRTAGARFQRGVTRVEEWCRKNRHAPVPVQQKALSQKLRGHYLYYGMTGNSRALSRFRYRVMCSWHKWLNRRSQKRQFNWEKFNGMLKRYPLPPARLPKRRPTHEQTSVTRSRMREIRTSGSVGGRR